MLALFSNRFVQLGLAVIVALIFGFTSGYSYKADKVELERLQQFEVIQGKLDKVREFSQDQAHQAQSNILYIDSRLSTILGRVNKQKPLTNVPCVPSEDFSKIWSEIDNVTKKPNTE